MWYVAEETNMKARDLMWALKKVSPDMEIVVGVDRIFCKANLVTDISGFLEIRFIQIEDMGLMPEYEQGGPIWLEGR